MSCPTHKSTYILKRFIVFEFTVFRHIKDPRPYPARCTFAKACEYFLEALRADEKQRLPLWSPTTFKPGQTRSKASAESIHWLVYDVDESPRPFSVWRLFSEWSVLAHTSWSHSPHSHKYRIILPLAEPIPAQDWPRASQAALELWSKVVGSDAGEPDTKALVDSARIYFRFGHNRVELPKESPMNPSNYHQTGSHSGPLLRLDYAHIPKPKPIKRAHTRYRDGSISLNQGLEITSVRETLASTLGAHISGNEARKITCPGCGRSSVHFSLDLSYPSTTKWPSCNHQNSCGWWGTFQDL
jgi:hypothetical protein